jgi:hypothetical protein
MKARLRQILPDRFIRIHAPVVFHDFNRLGQIQAACSVA